MTPSPRTGAAVGDQCLQGVDDVCPWGQNTAPPAGRRVGCHGQPAAAPQPRLRLGAVQREGVAPPLLQDSGAEHQGRGTPPRRGGDLVQVKGRPALVLCTPLVLERKPVGSYIHTYTVILERKPVEDDIKHLHCCSGEETSRE